MDSIDVSAIRIKDSKKAALYKLTTGDAVWLPKSQVVEKLEGTIAVPLWLAKKTKLLQLKKKGS